MGGISPNENWIMLNPDYSWEEVWAETDSDAVDLGAEVEPTATARASVRMPLPAPTRAFDSSRLASTCRHFQSRTEVLAKHLQLLHEHLREFDDPGLASHHQPVHDALLKLCRAPLKLFLAGSESSLKHRLLKGILHADPSSCPYSDRTTVWYRSSGLEPLAVLIHFRQDL